MSHQVALSFEDGVTRFITCQDDQTVADASYRARINIPLDCRDGACGTCKAVCESGTYDGGFYIEDALTEKEAAEGYCLPCSMKPRSDLVLQIASTSAVAKTSAATYTTTVTALERLSPTTVSIEVQAPPEGILTFLPGQYVNITVPGSEESRSYSFSSAPDAEELGFLVKVTPGGLMSEYLTSRAAVGDEITFTGPHGSFFLREAERPALLLAGGTGLAPILSILRKLAADRSDRRVHLVYGVTTDDDLVEFDTLDALASEIPSFTWDHCVADKASRAAHVGYVTSLIEAEHLNGGDVAVYLCGPPPMVEAVRSDFTARGVEPTGFYYEKFTPAVHTAPPVTEVVQEEADAELEAVETAAQPEPTRQPETVQPETGQPETVSAPIPKQAGPDRIAADGDPLARRIAGQVLLPPSTMEPLHAAAPSGADTDWVATARSVMGQRVARVGSDNEVVAVDEAATLIEAPDARNVAGQLLWPQRSIDPLFEPTVEPTAEAETEPEPQGATILPDGYEIGEEHPSVHESDAVFEARQALELGALELVIGRLSSRQLVGYRLLAEATMPYVDGDRFVDAVGYTETNAAFHDYLFMQTGNDHLLQAYHALGVKGAMEEALRHATWCHPLCAQDHLDIVDAIEAKDRERARSLIAEHADRSKITMRRAMNETMARKQPAFVTPGRFAGKVVVVTGAAQGIGECAARRIAAEGGALVLADRSDLVEQLATELSTDGGPAHAVIADLETWEGASAVIEKAIAQHGRIDVSVHTVGGTIWAKPFAEYPPEQVQAEISRSLFPTLWSCRAVLPHMIERGSGTIVNVSSVATRGLNRVPYAAAKGGVNAITSALALEAAPHGIRVVATAPGGTEAPPRRVPRGPAPESEQEEAWYRTIVDQTVESSLMKRYGTLDEQAAAICFLASDEASYITGTVLPVAGGDLG